MEYVPKSEIERRIARLQEAIAQSGMEGCLIVQGADLFYFTGTIQNAVLWVPAAGEPVLAVRMSCERAKTESPLGSIAPMRSYKQLPEILGFKSSPRRVGMELDVLPGNVHAKLAAVIGSPETVDASRTVGRIRSVKSA